MYDSLELSNMKEQILIFMTNYCLIYCKDIVNDLFLIQYKNTTHLLIKQLLAPYTVFGVASGSVKLLTRDH